MILPRSTVYPALAALLFFFVAGIPLPRVEPESEPASPSAARGSSPSPAGPERFKRVVVLGIDGLDPELLSETIERFPKRMRHFQRLVDEGGLHSLGTSIPPQSPVAWSNFITGMDPGGHGVFDFIHRDPMLRVPAPGSVREVKGSEVSLWGDWKFPIGGDTPSNRSGEAFWVTLARAGVPADIWRMPANFPVEPAEGLSFSGMMTPALDSAYGEYTIYTSDPPVDAQRSGGRFVTVREFGQTIVTELAGPPNTFKVGDPHQRAPLSIYVDREGGAAVVDTGAATVVLAPGEWSDFCQVDFDLLPVGVLSISGVVRFYLRSLDPFELYASPVNIDPRAPAMPVSLPEEASAELAEAIGLYYTQGMAEEVNALKDEAIDESEFMAQTRLIYDQRVRMMDYALDRYLEGGDGGLFFFYYSTVDLNCHMMWRVHDEAHPAHQPVAEFAARDSSDWSGREGSTWKDVIYDLYLLMDPVLGKLRERVGEEALIVVMSDHGFESYRRKFSLNTWLLEEGYLVLKDGLERELPRDHPDYSQVHLVNAVDWSRTRAYGMGFNGLYLNLAGRELDNPDTPDTDESGIVQPGAQAEELVAELKRKLEAIDDAGTKVVLRADVTAQVYAGARKDEAPDIQVGYNAGYGNADASSVGRIPNAVLSDNLGGTFNGNHLMAPDVVAGTLLTNGTVLPGEHRLEDLTVELLEQYGIAPGADLIGHPVFERNP
ncbi:MAG: alkaline phosphatase family protein [Planctomycetota bacterium]|jgi:predicted AlkP superfamily phosphohydrolase/phosphomutase|nr:alkaline phosphatase family protein [Planctomycetota bacterium]MDP6989395.1 alkaline phosphatase family protein [Planctomycetota bacterium]